MRLHSLLVTPGGNDFYGVIRTDLLRSVPPHQVFYNADRVFMAGLILVGRFAHVPQVLYYRRDHPQRASRAGGIRARVEALGAGRVDRLRNPVVRLVLQYLLGLLLTVLRSPLSVRAKMRCLVAVLRWLLTHVVPGRARAGLEEAEVALSTGDASAPAGNAAPKRAS